MKTVEIQFTCKACNQANVKLRVAERGPTEDVRDFVDRAATAAGSIHLIRSPRCTSRQVDLKIEMVEGKPIGEARANERETRG